MLSAILPTVGDKPIGQLPHIIRILKGVFNERPPVVRLVPEWDLHLVLRAIQKYPFETLPKTSLKYVTFKTAFPLAITTFCRTGVFQALRLGEDFFMVRSEGITFI